MAVVVIAGVEQKMHYLAMDLPQSDDCFVAAFPAETTEAFLEGHVRAFAYFGGVPTRILYDNTKIAVAKILGGEERKRTRAFSELQSCYLFADKFGRPLAGWQLPECFVQLRRLLEARLSRHGSREYVQVLRLLETFALPELTAAVEDALRLGTIGFDAVRHLLLCRIERRPPRLDMENWPHLPLAEVRTTQAADYMTLLAGVSA